MSSSGLERLNNMSSVTKYTLVATTAFFTTMHMQGKKKKKAVSLIVLNKATKND